jgi:hypothetical protein
MTLGNIKSIYFEQEYYRRRLSLSLSVYRNMNELKLICGSGQPERFLSLHDDSVGFSEVCV